MKVKIKEISLTCKELDYLSDALIYLEKSYRDLEAEEPGEYSHSSIDTICSEIRHVSDFIDYLIDYGKLVVSLEDESGEDE